MFFVYVLRSIKNKKRYTGCTSKSPVVRLKEHNSGTDDWTRQNGPFKLIYTEKHETKRAALRRERFLKTGVGRKFIDKHVPR